MCDIKGMYSIVKQKKQKTSSGYNVAFQVISKLCDKDFICINTSV